MMRKQNPGDQSVGYTKIDEPEKVVKLSPSEELASVQFRINKPEHTSVIPAKRRSVKRMMFDDFLQFIANALCHRNEPNRSSFKNTRTVYPHNPQQLGLIVHGFSFSTWAICVFEAPIYIYRGINNNVFVIGYGPYGFSYSTIVVSTRYSSLSF